MKKSTYKKLENIAAKELGIESLKTQMSDGLDFHEVAVWSLEEALKAAYELGKSER